MVARQPEPHIQTDVGQTKVINVASCLPADCTDAGTGTYRCEIYHNNKLVPVTLSEERNKVHKVHFTPEGAGLYKISCYFNENEVKGSPYTLEIVDTNAVMTTGDGLKTAAVNHTAKFTVTTHAAGGGEPTVTITAPSGKRISTKIVETGKNVFQVEYTPTEIGEHDVEVVFYGKQVYSGQTQIYNAGKVQVAGIQKHAVKGVPVDFEIDASSAGSGNLEIIVNNGVIPCKVHNLGNRKFLASFLPIDPVSHVVEMRFNGESVPGSPWVMEVIDASKVRTVGEVSQLIPVHRKAEIALNTTASGKGAFDVKVTGPNGVIVPSKLIDNRNGNYKVEYVPNEVGSHQLDILFGGQPIVGSPFLAKAYDPSAIRVTKLPDGHIGKTVEFEVDVTRAGEGQLEIMVNQGAVPNSVQMLRKGVFRVVFVPRTPADHEVDIKFNGDRVPSCPMISKVRDASHIALSGFHNAVSVRKPAGFRIKGAQYHNDLKVFITWPDGRDVPVHVVDSGDSTYRVDWTASLVGDYQVNVLYSGTHIPGSPFLTRACDPSKVQVSNVGPGRVGKPTTFNIDASRAGAGNLEIIVSARNENVPNFVQQEGGQARFNVSFTPQVSDTHVVSMKFNGDPVPGSPFHCAIVDGSKCSVSGDGLSRVPVNKMTWFVVDPHGTDADCIVEITAPSGRVVPARVTGSPNTGFRIEFTPTEVGRHQTKIFYADTEVKGSPFFCDAYDAGKVILEQVRNGLIDTPVHMEVDASQAGEGSLEADVRSRNVQVPSEIKPKGNGMYDLSFVPRDMNTHVVNLFFNEEHARNSPWMVDIIDASHVTASGDGLRLAPVQHVAWFEVDTHGPAEAPIGVKITAPSGATVPCRVTPKPGTVNQFIGEYTPIEPGRHLVEIKYGTASIVGSPFACEAYDASRVRVTDTDYSGRVNQQLGFTVDSSLAGQGTIDAQVTAPSGRLVRLNRERLSNTLHRFTYMPEEPGDHQVEVTFNYEKIPGCPFKVFTQEVVPRTEVDMLRTSLPRESSMRDMRDGGMRETTTRRTSYFMIQPQGTQYNLRDMTCIVQAPNGNQVPAKIVQTPEGDFRAEYSSPYTGRHIVEIFFCGQPIKGSPFYVDIYDPDRVRVERLEEEAFVQKETGINIKWEDAGKAEVTIKLIGPSGQNIPFTTHNTPEGTKVNYVPTEFGTYRIHVFYGGQEISGSPFIQEVREQPLYATVQRQTIETQRSGSPYTQDVRSIAHISAYGDGLYKGEEDQPATFMVDSKGMKGDLFVQVDGPNSIAKCNIDPERDGLYAVTYVPVEVGMYNIQVKWNGMEIPGSPFHPRIVDARKVKVLGGWQSFLDSNNQVRLSVGEAKRVAFDCSEAGPGKLKAEVIGPAGRLPVEIENTSDFTKTVIFTPTVEGEYKISLWWSEVALPKSPYKGLAAGHRLPVDHTKVTMTGRGLKEAKVGHEAEFVIDGSQAGAGTPEVSMTGVKEDIHVKVKSLGGDKYRCTYTAQSAGAYLLNIQWSHRQVKGAPFKVNVSAGGDASKVVASGEGLRTGIMSKEIKSIIDTRRAGPGELTAHCMGPSRAAHVELFDHRDGTFSMSVKPQEAGKHILTVKYGGEHIQGSPYVLRVSGAPDASKVRVSGPGVSHGILARYQSRFLVDTKGAGAGQLTVRIRGPKGAFRVEMQRESQKDRTILCRYDPTEVGDYIIHVKWSGEHVPGSPFQVRICDTEEEYERYMHELRTGVALQGRPGSGGYSTLPSSHGYGTMHSNGGYWNGHPDATYATYDFRS
ncbi:filamin-C [Lingula anatina]|uniref:Filamin-C n=1 Tax=Lingula anatina TaxID=7574 RepID=A0A2R2MQV6_LINAN|nr:filamin-C [Lingula anatina]|eukprot:XP_023932625.1 filamin-C [Lingula anatina]